VEWRALEINLVVLETPPEQLGLRLLLRLSTIEKVIPLVLEKFRCITKDITIVINVEPSQ
jgi:hypothetical protein